MADPHPAETNLELDLDPADGTTRHEDAVRIAVAHARAYTRHAGAPIVTEDCTTYATLEREIERLKAELDAALEAGAAHFAARAETHAHPAERSAPPAPPKAHVDLGLAVEDVMTRDVKTVGANDALTLVDELMKVGRFRHVVVLDDDAHVAGVISQRDIFFGALAWAIGHGLRAHTRALETSRAKDVMHASPVTTSPETPLTEAAALMASKKIGCLPVVDGLELVGILTEGDFLALLAST